MHGVLLVLIYVCLGEKWCHAILAQVHSIYVMSDRLSPKFRFLFLLNFKIARDCLMLQRIKDIYAAA
jgi:hypothetical protein